MDLAQQLFRVILFWLANASVLALACSLARRLRPRDHVGFWAASLVIYLSIICAALCVLGFTSLLEPWIIIPISLIPGAYFLVKKRSREKPIFTFDPEGIRSLFPERVLFLMLALAVIFAFSYRLWRPDFKHDPLTYQLYFPAQWLQHGRLEIIPTPFGDNSRAYEPSDASLYYMWLMLPMRGDMFSQAGQMPFFILALIALAGISRRLGAGRPWHLLPSIFLIFTPLAFDQAISAEADIALAGAFLAAIYFLAGFSQDPSSREDIPAALSLGLLCGTKYIGAALLVLLSPLIVYALVKFFMKTIHGFARLILWLALIFMTGGFWYARNLAATGNPVYPMEVSFSGRVLFSGAYSAMQMKNWIYHLDGLAAQKEMLLSILSPLVLLVCVCSILAALGMSAFKKTAAPRGVIVWICILPAAAHLLLWYVVPFQVDRFWLSAVVLLFAAVAVNIGFLPKLAYLYAAVLILYALLSLSGREPQTRVPLHIFIPAASLAAALVISVFRNTARTLLALVFLMLLGSLFATYGWEARRSEYFRERWEFGKGWNYISSLPVSKSIAYTGSNVPYPLLGPRLNNRVQYVNVNSGKNFAFHDYDRLLKESGGFTKPNTPEPALYRLEWDPAAWRDNLVEKGADHLFVTRVGKAGLVNISHDRMGWPVESRWALESPEIFRLMYQDNFVQVFQVSRDASPVSPEMRAQVLRRPIDALAVYERDQEAFSRFFPLSAGVIQEYGLKALFP